MNNIMPVIFSSSADASSGPTTAPMGTPGPNGTLAKLEDTLKKTNSQMSQAFASLIIASMGFMAALAWNDAAKNVFEHSALKKFTRFGPIAYAVIATIVAFLVSKALSKYSAPVCTVLCDKTIKDLSSAMQPAPPPRSSQKPVRGPVSAQGPAQAYADVYHTHAQGILSPF